MWLPFSLVSFRSFAILAFAFPALALGDDAATARQQPPTEQPATNAPAAEKHAADYSSPKATMKTLLLRVKNGEISQIEDCFVEPQNDQQSIMLRYGMSDDIYIPALHQALSTRFGEENSPLGRSQLAFDQQLQLIDSMEETIEGNRGRLAPKGLPTGGMHFAKMGDDWKLTITASPTLRPVPPQHLPAAQGLRAAYLQTIRELGEGKYSSVEEAMQAVETRRKAVVQAAASK